jgi:hypothetical protein
MSKLLAITIYASGEVGVGGRREVSISSVVAFNNGKLLAPIPESCTEWMISFVLASSSVSAFQ